MQRVAAVQVFFLALKRRLMSAWGNALRITGPQSPALKARSAGGIESRLQRFIFCRTITSLGRCPKLAI